MYSLTVGEIFHEYKTWEDIPYDDQCRVDVAIIAIDLQWIQTIEQVPLQLQQDASFRCQCIVLGFYQRCHLPQITTYCDCDYNELPDEWKANPKVIAAALSYLRATVVDLPEPYRSDEHLLRQAIPTWPRLSSGLPDFLRNYWLSNITLIMYSARTLVKTHQTVLADDCSFWFQLLNCCSRIMFDEKIVGLVEEYASERLQLDRELMLAVFEKDAGRFFEKNVDAAIWHDELFMRTVCESLFEYQLALIPTKLQRLYPHLILEIVVPRLLEGVLATSYLVEFGKHLAVEFWNDYKFVKTWFSDINPSIGQLLPDDDSSLQLKQEPFLWIAEHCEQSAAADCFLYAPDELLEDKSFMLKAIKLNPQFLFVVSDKLRDDMDLRMVACSLVSDKLDTFLGDMKYTDMKETLEYAQTKYSLYHESFQTFLCCMSHKFTAAPVTLLNQGPSTSMAYKLLVAEYLGAPIGNELLLVQQCMENIAKLDMNTMNELEERI